jgi:cell division protein FtsN
MANFERDKEDVRVYDGSEDDEDGEGSHLPVVIIIAILVLAAFGGVVWLAYNQGVARGRNDPVRLAAADTANPGNGIKVYQQPAGAEDEDEPAAKQAEPPKSQPTEKPTLAQPVNQVHAEAAAPPPPKASVASPPALAPAKPLPQPPAAATKPPAQLGLAARPAPEASTPPPAVKPIPPKPVAAAPAPKAAAVTLPPKPVVATPKPVAAAPIVAAPSGSYLLQIGAYKSEAEATAAWKTYQGKHTTLLSGFGPDVQRADLGDKGVWYRLRISSFADKDAAIALCDRLKAQNGACFLAR